MMTIITTTIIIITVIAFVNIKFMSTLKYTF